MADTRKAFDGISPEYQRKALVQQQAALKLAGLLKIQSRDKILDLGCGPGHVTYLLKKTTQGWVLGTDISEAMIRQARQAYPDISFRVMAAEDLDFHDLFDVIFCNSALQWFPKPARVMKSAYAALKSPGRLGVACPATSEFSSLFTRIQSEVTARPGIRETFAHWKNPWFFLPGEDAYRKYFEAGGFATEHLEIANESTECTAAEAYGIYLSGFANGLLGKAFYDVGVPEDYTAKVNQGFREALEDVAVKGKVTVDFNRLYYIGKK